MLSTETLAWLAAGDPAVAFQTWRDLGGDLRPQLQARIVTEGVGAQLLQARRADEHWGLGFYQPKWTSTHYTLLEFVGLAVSPEQPALRASVAMVLREQKASDGGVNPTGSVKSSDVCVNGMALTYAAYFRADEVDLTSVVDLLLGQRMPDGGFNCRSNRSGARHSSVHTTTSVIEGCTAYLERGYRHRAAHVRDARAGAVEFLLRHQLFRSERTGAPIHPEFTRLHHPPRWYFDVLRGLEAVQQAGYGADGRLADALAILRRRRRADGRWVAARAHPGVTHVPVDPAGQPSRWVTLRAARALLAAERAAG